MIDEDQGKVYLERFGKGTKGAGWYSFDTTACISSAWSTSSI